MAPESRQVLDLFLRVIVYHNNTCASHINNTHHEFTLFFDRYQIKTFTNCKGAQYVITSFDSYSHKKHGHYKLSSLMYCYILLFLYIPIYHRYANLYADYQFPYLQITKINMSWKQSDSRYIALTFGLEMLNK